MSTEYPFPEPTPEARVLAMEIQENIREWPYWEIARRIDQHGRDMRLVKRAVYSEDGTITPLDWQYHGREHRSAGHDALLRYKPLETQREKALQWALEVAQSENRRLRAQLEGRFVECVYETRSFPDIRSGPSYATGSWCRTHGWECPNA